MKSIRFWGIVISGVLSLAIALPARADQANHVRQIEGLFQPEPDFFETGRNLFEEEIEHLLEPEPAMPLLIIDESITFEVPSSELDQLLPPPQPEISEPDS